MIASQRLSRLWKDTSYMIASQRLSRLWKDTSYMESPERLNVLLGYGKTLAI